MDKINEIADAINKIEKTYFECVSKDLENTAKDTCELSLEILKEELYSENPSYENLIELSIALHNELVSVTSVNNAIKNKVIPIVIELLKYINS